MGDRVGLFFMLGMVILLVVGLIMLNPRRGTKDQGLPTETLNRHVEDTMQARVDHPEGAERSHLVGNPPVDSVTTEGWGVATPGRARSRSYPWTFTRSCTTATASGAASDATPGRMPLSRLPGHVPVEGGRESEPSGIRPLS